MCLIVDANTASEVFADPPSADFKPLRVALDRAKAFSVHGGKLSREYYRTEWLRRMLLRLDQQGILRKVPDKQVDAMTLNVRRENRCRSNDHHIIALARIAEVRLLCSRDKDLHADFTNPLILKPAGSVYQNPSHKRLIRKHCSKHAKQK